MQQKSARGATIKNATLTMSQMGLHAGNGSYCVEEEELIEWEILLRVSNGLLIIIVLYYFCEPHNNVYSNNWLRDPRGTILIIRDKSTSVATS